MDDDSVLATASAHRATSFAATVDVAQAGAALELGDLAGVSAWLGRAAGHYSDANEPWLAARAEAAADAALHLATPADMYAFHGVLRQLHDDALAEGGQDAATVFWAGLLVVGVLLVGDAVENWRAQHARDPGRVRFGVRRGAS